MTKRTFFIVGASLSGACGRRPWLKGKNRHACDTKAIDR
jgi:hypothetical protein